MEINASHVDDRASLIKNYASFLESQFAAKDVKAPLEFAKFYLKFFPLDAWIGRELSDLHGFLFGVQLFIKPKLSSGPRIRVFNPNLDEHGWVCGRTVIVVLQQDMPFLVDSIRLELNRRELPIHVVQSTVMSVTRDGEGIMTAVENCAPVCDIANGPPEALIYIETSLHTEEDDLSEIRLSIEHVLADVGNVVSDYKSILKRLETTGKNVAHHQPDAKEPVAFLRWLKSRHFTFLGFREYELVTKSRRKGLRENTKSRLGIFRKLGEANNDFIDLNSNDGMRNFHGSDDVVFFSKSSTRSNVHRGAYPDYIVAKKYDEAGKVCGEVRFLGLFTYSVFTMSPLQIPLLREKVDRVVARTELDPQGYYGKHLLRVIENFPKEELFQSDEETLFQNIWSIASINERRMVRLIVRKDPFGSFVNCMVYVPRDLYNTHVRQRIERLIGSALGSTECDSTTFFSESTLARAQFVFRIDDDKNIDLDLKALELSIVDITKNWVEHLHSALIDHYGEAEGTKYFNAYHNAFSPAYQEHFDARLSVSDIEMLETLKNDDDIAMNLYRPVNASEDSMRFKVMHLNAHLELSHVIPILENLGLRVLGEHPYKITLSDTRVVWLHDFQLAFGLPVNVDVHAVRAHFEEAFANIWRGRSESDAFNRLILGARLNWREVTMLRAYANYLKQIGFNTTQAFIADTLVHHLDITRNLVALFKASFDPRVYKNMEEDGRVERLRAKVLEALDGVSNLNEDRVLRRYLDLMNGTLRTNYFQKDEDEQDKSYISIKFSPRDIAEIPEPRPMFEIFVYSPRVEGVHLRGGKVARGGLRWSDRLQDYRTEVLGLVKAQQVKNAVIVPNGAKGGFVAKNLDKAMSRKEFLDEGIACYKTFIQGLLDITDNFVEGQVITPVSVLRKDADDPYLVVAADKGTATFSDIANEISAKNGFWLGDAFASGGSQGYDHKGMGITAKGAWISVQRHFREKGIDIQSEDFTVVGIGDMAGDVFGNGMLLSEHIKLLAAFNHLHIFVDPTPDSAVSFIERKRLFETPGVTWEDYDEALISKGGGVFSRTAKSIAISPAMKNTFGINEDKMAPNDFISALLKSPVDLIWNGGIGTYVKASWESHTDVGDKANDALRVNGRELQCQVFGEGGNLGLTQLGRVEFALHGGACNTDFIDNAAGVDCSDHEVNIKILLDELVKAGDVTTKQRNKLLADMTDSVAELVLQNNYRQTLSISLAEYESLQRGNEYRRFISFMESEGKLDRQLEFLPGEESLSERQAQGKGLTRPELSVLISYAKVMLKEALITSDIAEDAYIVKEIESAFPPTLRKKYHKEIYTHRLRREIVGTQVANDLINNLGITAGHRLLETTGAPLAEIARAYIVSRDVFQFEKFQHYIKSMDNRLPAEFQHELMNNMIRRVRRGTRWFLRNRRSGLNPMVEVPKFKKALHQVQAITGDVVVGSALEQWQQRSEYLTQNSVIDEWVQPLSMPANLFSGLSIVEAGNQSNGGLEDVASVFFLLLDRLGLNWFATQISNVRVESYWQAMARESYIDDLEAQLRKLTVSLVRLREDRELEDLYESWARHNRVMVNRWRSMVNEVQGAQMTDYAMFSVAMRELIDLAQATEHRESL